MTPPKKTFRCAVYTRKSSEEGLEQDFNSLDAQREACEAYIKSQAHEGWRLLQERFDDGGFSGGSLERPALNRLLEQIREKQVDIIVIYKIDRLTRSLMDFAKLAELFDRQGVSFVSVTQQFNTTTSMGRLMLNVLLSFAQFEREITGERIRDKIAASKKKGIWMGGSVPAGYDVKDRALVINEGDATTVRTLFRLYAELGSVRKVWAEAGRLKLQTPVRTSGSGRTGGGKPFHSHNLYQLLSSPIYIGKLPHKGQVYDGNHPPLIDLAQWQAVQSGIAGNRVDRRYGRNVKIPSPLTGLLFDAKGTRFTPTNTQKKGQRYRYYIDPALTTGMAPATADLPRIPALEIEHAVRKGLAQFLNDPKSLLNALGSEVRGTSAERAIGQASELAAEILEATPTTWMPLIGPALERIVIHENAIVFSIVGAGLQAALEHEAHTYLLATISSRKDPDRKLVEYRIAATIRMRKGTMKLVIGNSPAQGTGPDPVLLAADQEIELVDQSVARGFPRFAGFLSAQPVSLDEVQSLLRVDEALLAYQITKDGVVVWVLRPNRADIIELSAKSDDIVKLTKRLRASVDWLGEETPVPFDLEASYELYSTAFEPVEKDLEGVKRILVVPEGPLASIPFHLLITAPAPVGDEFDRYRAAAWLLRKYDFVTLPGVSTLRVLRGPRSAANDREPFLGFGDPVLAPVETSPSTPTHEVRGGFIGSGGVRAMTSLLESGDELRAIAKALSSDPARLFLKERATISELRRLDNEGELARPRIVAFATHALVAQRGENGLPEAGLVFTPPPLGQETTIDNGFLSSSDVLGLHFNADWIVLSACNTAAESDARDHPISGLGRAFFYAGTDALLISNWNVASSAAESLMTNVFQRTAEGEDKAHALGEAMLGLLDDRQHPSFSHPAIWAPFIIMGD